MDNAQKTVVVYCASSAAIDKNYLNVASRLGELFADNKIVCVNGAGKEGLMGALNDAVLENGGQVKGVIPRFMVESGWVHPFLTDTLVTETIHERKALMAELADAVITLPGGVGTLEELAEIITWKQLGLFHKPIVILNFNNYYDHLLAFFETMITEKFLKEEYRELWRVVYTPQEALDVINSTSDWISNYTKYD